MRLAGPTGGIVAAAVLGGVAPAQDNAVTTIPAPGMNRYSLPPGDTSEAPVPAATLIPPPQVVRTLPVRRRLEAAPDRTQPPLASIAPTATPTPIAPIAPPIATATPVLPEDRAPAVARAPQPAPWQSVVWPWWLLGLALVAAGGMLVARRARTARAGQWSEPEPAAPEPAPPTPVAPAPPQLAIDFRPQRLWTRGPDAHLAYEVMVTNTGTAPVDGLRLVIALASAGPDTAAQIAAFRAGTPSVPGREPFALRAGETRTVAGDLTLAGDAMYVTSAADRDLIVPIALVSLEWGAGPSLARMQEDFVIGTGDATTPRLGPIWVDRAGLAYARLDARRFSAG